MQVAHISYEKLKERKLLGELNMDERILKQIS
jgi:hypothetical protein